MIHPIQLLPGRTLSISREVGLIWQRERKGAGLKEFIDFAASHCRDAEDAQIRDKEEA
jgi:hypothetical protein